MDLLEKALVASGTEMTTVAMRRHASGTPYFSASDQAKILRLYPIRRGVAPHATPLSPPGSRAKPWGLNGLRLR